MLRQIGLLSLLALGALAQTTVQPVFLAAPSETNGFVGSVVDVANGLTTYAIACTSGVVSCVSAPISLKPLKCHHTRKYPINQVETIRMFSCPLTVDEGPLISISLFQTRGSSPGFEM